MSKKSILKHADFIILDLICLFVSLGIAMLMRHGYILTGHPYDELVVFELLINIVLVFLTEPYQHVLKNGYFVLFTKTFLLDALQLLLVNFALFALKDSSSVSRLIYGYQYLIYFFVSYVLKVLLKNYLLKQSKKAIKEGNNTLLIVTEKDKIDSSIKSIEEDNFEFNRILGLCILDENLEGQSFGDIKVIANKEDLLSYVCVNQVDAVFINMNYEKVPEEVLNGFAIAGIKVHIRLRKIDALIGQEQTVSKLLNYSVLTSSIKERTNLEIIAKRALDILGGLVGTLITLVLCIFIGPIIYIKSPGPIFYKQERIGLNGRHFKMIKFRSMVMNAEDHLQEVMKYNRVSSDFMFKMENDPRIIPGIGNFIRKTSLDEFPQFINVLKGDMSLVGTRPPTVNEFEKYELKHRIRMSTKPGITGMWQTSGRNNITDFDEVVKLDAYYINNWSMGLDIRIILKTIRLLLKHSKDEAM